MTKIKELMYIITVDLLCIVVYLIWVYWNIKRGEKGEKKGQRKRKRKGLQRK